MHKDIMHTHSYWGPIYVTVMATLEVSRRKPNSSGGRTPQLGWEKGVRHHYDSLRPWIQRRAGECGNWESLRAICVRLDSLRRERGKWFTHYLPRYLPKLLGYLVLFVVFCLKIVPLKANGIFVSPKELLTGRKVNYKRDLRFSVWRVHPSNKSSCDIKYYAFEDWWWYSAIVNGKCIRDCICLEHSN